MKSSIFGGVCAAVLFATAALAQPAPPPGGPRGPGPDAGGPPPTSVGPRREGAPPPPKSAHFQLGQGDSFVDVKCADDEPMRVCADIVTRLVDRVFAPNGSRPTPPSPSADTPPPPPGDAGATPPRPR